MTKQTADKISVVSSIVTPLLLAIFTLLMGLTFSSQSDIYEKISKATESMVEIAKDIEYNNKSDVNRDEMIKVNGENIKIISDQTIELVNEQKQIRRDVERIHSKLGI
jgi:hypothetical protein